MRHPGELIRNTPLARVNHWITAACFILLMLSGLSMFHPLLFWLSAFFGGGQWARAIHPWIGLVLTGLAIWEVYFFSYTSIETQRIAALIHFLAATAAIIIWIVHVYAAI